MRNLIQTISNKVKRSISWYKFASILEKSDYSCQKRESIRFKPSQTIRNVRNIRKFSQIFENLQFEQRINIERRPNRREKRVDEQVKRGGIAILEPPPQVVAGP